jgi:branched-subunit amino acid ABC-type transport system permease component
MPFWLTLAVSGLLIGLLYSMMAFGVVLIYRSTGILNFAHTAIAAFFALLFRSLVEDHGWPKWLGLPATLAVAFVSGMILYHLVLRRMRHAPVLNQVVATLALALVVQAVIGVVFSTNIRTIPALFPLTTTEILGLSLSWHQIGVALTGAVVAGALSYYFSRTRSGLSIRALADNRQGAALMGISVVRSEALIWGIAAVLAALAGILLGPLTLVDLRTVASLMVKVFAAALIGGLAGYGGAVGGAILLGVAEAEFAGYVTSPEVRESLPFFLVIAALLFRPALQAHWGTLRARFVSLAPAGARSAGGVGP